MRWAVEMRSVGVSTHHECTLFHSLYSTLCCYCHAALRFYPVLLVSLRPRGALS